MKQPFKVIALTAFVFTDCNGEEGILAMQQKNGEWMPLIGASEERIESFRSYAEKIARRMNCPVQLVKFSVREEIETINRGAGGH